MAVKDKKKVRLGNWISQHAKQHLSDSAKAKKMSESSLLEIQIMKIK